MVNLCDLRKSLKKCEFIEEEYPDTIFGKTGWFKCGSNCININKLAWLIDEYLEVE